MPYKYLTQFERELLEAAVEIVTRTHTYAEMHATDDEYVERKIEWARGCLLGIRIAANKAREQAGNGSSPMASLLDYMRDFHLPMKEGEVE